MTFLEAIKTATQGDHDEEDAEGQDRDQGGGHRPDPESRPQPAEVAGTEVRAASGFAFPKPTPRPPREPKRLNSVSKKRAARIAAGEERPGMARTWMKKHPPKRLDGPGSDPGRLAFARSLPCVGLSHLPDHRCRGRNTASHLRDHTGAGLMEADSETCCMCWSLHLDAWEIHRGPFEGWSTETRVAWMRARCEETQTLWNALPEERRTWWREVGAQCGRDAIEESA